MSKSESRGQGPGRFFDLARDSGVDEAGFLASREEHPSGVRLGDRVGEFLVTGIIGSGGMGRVYRAVDNSGREVALKVLLRGRTGILRFRREGEITASLRHPNILTIHAAGEHEGHCYQAYELVESCCGLDEALMKVDLRRGLEMIRDASRGVGYAHANGVVHRDLKPDNILVDPEQRVRVADFGLARGLDSERLTQSGVLMGTPQFMAPEQMQSRREEISSRTDVWALGTILYWFLTKTHPFEGTSLPDLMIKICIAPLEPPRSIDPKISPVLEAVCLRALDRDQRVRYADGHAFADDLDAILEGRPPSVRPVRSRLTRLIVAFAVVAVVAVVVLAVLVVVLRAKNKTVDAIDPDTGATDSPDDPDEPIPPPPIPPPPIPPPPITGEGFTFAMFLYRAERGDASSMWKVGEHLQKGQDVDANPAQARLWFLKAAETNPRFKTRLAKKRLETDRAEGIALLREAVVAGDENARKFLVMEVDPDEGARLAAGWAEEGDLDAMYQIAMRLRTGRGVAPDPAKAHYWLSRASQGGHVASTWKLAGGLLNGVGCEADVPLGLKLLEEAAATIPDAARELSDVYERGLYGVPRNPDAAGKWRERGR